MKTKAAALLSALALLPMVFGVTAPGALGATAQGVDTGMEAFVRGDYSTALKGLKPLAADGFAPAEYDLAQMYDNALGTAQSYATAARWYLRAAEQGCGLAQERLGQMYAEGLGVARNYELAYFWLDEAAAHARGAHQAAVEDERYRALLQLPPAERLRASEQAAMWHARRNALTPDQLARAEAEELAGGGARMATGGMPRRRVG